MRTHLHLGFRHPLGAFFLVFAAAFSARQNTGILAYVYGIYGIPSQAVIVLFAVCALILLLVPVPPPVVLLLSLPLTLVATAGAIHALTDPTGTISGVVAYLLAQALILCWVRQASREGSDGTA